MANVSQRKPKEKVVSWKTLVEWASKGEPPESQDHQYEFGNGRVKKKAQYNGTGYDQTG